ncbi:MAG: bifunctional glutamate N-acetyltransferase/amino-acid acetyltransferase ArgJ [Clostridiales bacterium]|nr:bifunctional glutamate N-acetyltransferase/amino-acid acetyltransferase ArgJ [Clostridiales bacterium]
MKIIDGGITAAKGFQASACEAGIKYSGRTDMALIFSETPCESAGTYTSNIVKAAPVIWDRNITDSEKKVHAVVINSGIANACTGKEGLTYCDKTAKACAKELNIPEDSVLVASTGVIGMPIPVDKIAYGLTLLAPGKNSSKENAAAAARAIMTTDTMPKEIAVEFTIGGKTARIGSMCKGSGMIHPNMCTMLSFITTDANISKELLLEALREDVKDTYNMVSVDGDTSTNDSCIILANGEAGNEKITEKGEDYETFAKALRLVNETQAKRMAGDGEGATALFEVVVEGADTKETAVTVAKSVVSSSLVKTAIAGHDANWGRIFCAMGYSGAQFDPEIAELRFESKAGSILIAKNGAGVDFDEEIATKILSEPEVSAIINLHQGEAKATVWGCDLTHEYISINADYRS